MIGIVMIAHGKIASEMLLAVEHVLGEQVLIATLDVPNSDQPDSIQSALERLISQNNTGHGVLIFSDMFGGTPCNIALSAADKKCCEVVSGFNLPALIKAVSLRQECTILKDIANEAVLSGQQYMCRVSDFAMSVSKDSKVAQNA